MSKKVLIFLLLALLCVNVSAGTVSTGGAPGDGADTFYFIGKVVNIAEDPIEGVWVVLLVAERLFMVRYPAVELAVGDIAFVMGMYVGAIMYPRTGEVPVFVGMIYRKLE